jgi:hypothetical protein
MTTTDCNPLKIKMNIFDRRQMQGHDMGSIIHRRETIACRVERGEGEPTNDRAGPAQTSIILSERLISSAYGIKYAFSSIR